MKSLTKLTPRDVQALYARLEESLSSTTVRQVHAILHKALKQAVSWESLARNPTDHVQAPRAERKETTVLSPEQGAAFLDAAQGTRFEALFMLAVTTGMRQGELLGLRWRDLDFDRGVLAVRYAVQRIGGLWTFVEPKSAKSRRQIILNADVVEALRRHRFCQNSEREQGSIV